MPFAEIFALQLESVCFMPKKNAIKTLVLLLCGLIILGGIALVVLWLNNENRLNSSKIADKPDIYDTSTVSSTVEISEGEKVLIPGKGADNKQAAGQDIAAGKYQQAVAKLTQSLQVNRNDPEALIYLNNAKIGANKSYTIAAAVPSGTNVNGAKEILRGVAQAQQEINQAGGIKGVPLKVIITNDNNNPETVKKLAQELAKNPEVLGVVGHWASDVTLESAEVYQAEKLVAISPISTSVQLSSFGNYIFRTVPSDRFAGSALSRYMINQLKKKKAAVFFNSQSNYSKSLKDEFTHALFSNGGEVVGEFDFSKANFNPLKDWQQAKNQGAEVLMLAVTSNTIDQALQIIQVNDQRLSLLAGDDGYDPKILQNGGSDAVGMVLAIPWHILAHVNEPFARASRKLWGGDVNWRTALAYDATLAFVTGLKQTPNPTRQGLQEVLSNPGFSFQGASGSIRFLPSGDRNQAAQLVTIKPNNRSGFGYYFEPIPALNYRLK